MAYVDKLKAERTHYAKLAETHAVALLDSTPDNRETILDSLRDYSHMVETLTQQISWTNRNTLDSNGKLPVCYPALPAWTD